jgi:hypothetical protein
MKYIFLIFGLCTVVSAQGLDTAALVHGHESAALLEKNCIQTTVSGVLPPRWDTTTQMLNRPDFIQWIQSEYQRSVSKDGTCTFPIEGTGNGAYYYVNKKNQRTEIIELYRNQTSETTFDMIYHAKGKRVFGKYEVLIHVHAIDAGEIGTVYTATIHAYPHNGPLRFFARRLGTAERYFERKTKLIVNVTNKICTDVENSSSFSLTPSNAIL